MDQRDLILQARERAMEAHVENNNWRKCMKAILLCVLHIFFKLPRVQDARYDDALFICKTLLLSVRECQCVKLHERVTGKDTKAWNNKMFAEMRTLASKQIK